MSPFLEVGAFVVLCIAALVVAIYFAQKGTWPSESMTPRAVDPWQLQRRLMLASDQDVPANPCITRDTLLYWALICEEQGETSYALVDALLRLWPHQGLGTRTALVNLMAETGATMKSAALHARAAIASLPQFQDPLTPTEAAELLDGIVDVSVVTCGFAIAAGLPGAAGYLEVVSSNISKTNPSTGRIEKHPDGKWIKGSNYRAPDLASILAQGNTMENSHE